MSQQNKAGKPAPRGVWAALGVILILTLGMLGFFIAYSHLPRAGSGNNGTVSDLVTPTAVMVHAVETLRVERSADYAGLHITVTQVEEAASFSDDRKNSGAYTLRVHVRAMNGGQAPVGIDYPSSVRLLLPSGQEITPQLVSIVPVVLPKETQEGFFDFPLSTQVAISLLTLQLGSGTMVRFGG